MNEHPILFSADMVQAIREGRKIQTRRVVKDPHRYSPDHPLSIHKMEAVYPAAESGFIFWYPDHDGLDEFTKQQYKNGICCPYGQPGDRLWVRETWATLKEYDDLKPSKIPLYDYPPALYYRADTGAYLLSEHRGKWRPSIFMPRWASRLTLAVTGVRVERLRDISEEDAEAEGLRCPAGEDSLAYATWSAIPGFVLLWDRINAKRGYGWSTNPWVWIVEFEVVDA